MFKVAIYKRRDIENDLRVLLFHEFEGFALKSRDLPNGAYSDTWDDRFSIIDTDYILSKKDIENIRKINTDIPDEVEALLVEHSIEFEITDDFLISKDNKDIIKISLLNRIYKLDDNHISIEYSGKSEKIKCNQFDKLQKAFMNIKNIF